MPTVDRPTAPRRGEARLLYQPSKRGTSLVSSQRESAQHITEFSQPFPRSNSAAVDTKRDCGQLTFAESEHQAKRRADTPEPFTQIHRCVRAFLSPLLSKVKRVPSERTVRGLFHLTLNSCIAFAVLKNKELTRENESYLQRLKRSCASAGTETRQCGNKVAYVARLMTSLSSSHSGTKRAEGIKDMSRPSFRTVRLSR